MNVLIYGLGKRFSDNRDILMQKYNIVAIVDSNPNKQGRYEGIEVISPLKIENYHFDKIIITPENYDDIILLLQALAIPNEKIELFVSEEECGHIWSEVSLVPQYEDGILCQFDNICFKVKNTSDYMVMNDIFKKNSWDFHTDEMVIVVDIGMNIGLASLYFANMDNVEMVYGYEPFLETFHTAIQNVEMNDERIKDKIKLYNYGVLDEDKTMNVLYDSAYTTSNRIDGGGAW